MDFEIKRMSILRLLPRYFDDGYSTEGVYYRQRACEVMVSLTNPNCELWMKIVMSHESYINPTTKDLVLDLETPSSYVFKAWRKNEGAETFHVCHDIFLQTHVYIEIESEIIHLIEKTLERLSEEAFWGRTRVSRSVALVAIKARNFLDPRVIYLQAMKHLTFILAFEYEGYVWARAMPIICDFLQVGHLHELIDTKLADWNAVVIGPYLCLPKDDWDNLSSALRVVLQNFEVKSVLERFLENHPYYTACQHPWSSSN